MTVSHAPVLIGVLIDVSNSMQRSWRNADGNSYLASKLSETHSTSEYEKSNEARTRPESK